MRQTSALIAAIALAAAIAACGSSSDETRTSAPPASTSTAPNGEAPVGVRAKSCKAAGVAMGGEVRVTGVSCAAGRSIVRSWIADEGCSAPAGASRTSCKIGKLTCLGAVADRGIVVNCAGPGRSVSFVGRRG
jgi:hypothetical protein